MTTLQVMLALLLSSGDKVAESRALTYAAARGWKVKAIECSETSTRDKEGFVYCQFRMKDGTRAYRKCPGVFSKAETECKSI